MNKISSHDFCRDYVRKENYNLYLLNFFAPRDKRQNILAIMALHTELKLIPQKTLDPTLRLIRLQWWHNEIQKISNGQPCSNSPILDELKQLHIPNQGFDNYWARFTQSFQGQDSDIDESLYALFGHVINDKRANNRFSKKLFLHDNLPGDTIFRAFRLWIGV